MSAECFNCNKKAEHEHHVVPKIKGGIKTVALCVDCHEKVHDTKLSTNYLTRLGLIKAEKELLCRIFFLITGCGLSINEIRNELKTSNGIALSKQSIKRKIDRMKHIDANDLINVFNPILFFEKNKYYTKQYLINEWAKL